MPYSGDPAASPSDELRFLLGDTDPANPRLNDDEIDYLLATYGPSVDGGSMIKAAYQGALRLYTRYSGRMSKTVGPASLSYGELAAQYKTLLDELKRQGGALKTGTLPGPPTAGGLDAPMWSDEDWNGTLSNDDDDSLVT